DHRESPQHTLVVASLPTDPLWFWQQPDVLVVTDQRGLHACAPGDVANAQSGSLHHPNPSSWLEEPSLPGGERRKACDRCRGQGSLESASPAGLDLEPP